MSTTPTPTSPAVSTATSTSTAAPTTAPAVPARHLPAGTAAADGYDLVVTPASAGWARSSLRVLTLAPGAARTVETGGEELLVVPLVGGATVDVAGHRYDLVGRPSVFSGATDVLYLPPGASVELAAAAGGRFALAGAATDVDLPVRHVAASAVAVELRGAGQASRLVRDLGTPDAIAAGAVIVCEVVTPGGNWSSYPAHKHDEATATETELEEIYYFEIAPGPDGQPGFGFHRTSSSPGHPIDVLVEVRDRDTALVPFGWHGPTVAAPGHDMYYLNVMAGPAAQRSWRITDHPEQTWVRGTWTSRDVDPRLTDGRYGR